MYLIKSLKIKEKKLVKWDGQQNQPPFSLSNLLECSGSTP